MTEIRLLADVSFVVEAAAKVDGIGNQFPHAIRRALNHTGAKALTQVRRALRDQTGAAYRAIMKAVVGQRANYGSLTYDIVAKDHALSLKEFKPKQGGTGTAASPWNTRRVFPHAFMGPKPGAVSVKLGGHVYVRFGEKLAMTKGRYAGKKRQRIGKLWGPIIPNELVKGQSAAAFHSTVQGHLPGRLQHEIGAIMSGAAPPG